MGRRRVGARLSRDTLSPLRYAPYATNIIAARPRPDRTRLTMFNERVNLRHADGAVERRVMTDRDDMQACSGMGSALIGRRAEHHSSGTSAPWRAGFFAPVLWLMHWPADGVRE